MLKKTDIEVERAKILKAYRAAIRLKYALMADEEINETVPEIEEKFNEAIAKGKPFRLKVGEVFNGDS